MLRVVVLAALAACARAHGKHPSVPPTPAPSVTPAPTAIDYADALGLLGAFIAAASAGAVGFAVHRAGKPPNAAAAASVAAMLLVYAVFALAAGNAGGLFVYGLLGASCAASSGLCWAPRGLTLAWQLRIVAGSAGCVAGLKLLLLFLTPTACVCSRARSRIYEAEAAPLSPLRYVFTHLLETLCWAGACAASARVMRRHMDDEGATVEGGEPVSDPFERPATLRSMAMGSSGAGMAMSSMPSVSSGRQGYDQIGMIEMH